MEKYLSTICFRVFACSFDNVDVDTFISIMFDLIFTIYIIYMVLCFIL